MKIFYYIILFYSCTTFGQIIKELPTNETGSIVFTEVISVDSINKNELFRRAKIFFVEYYKSANHVIQLEDSENATLIGKASSSFAVSAGMGIYSTLHLKYTLKIQAKEGRYKYEIYDLIFSGTYGDVPAENSFDEKLYYKKKNKPNKFYKQYLDNTLETTANLIASLKEKMLIPSTSTGNKSDW